MLAVEFPDVKGICGVLSVCLFSPDGRVLEL